MKNGLFAKFYQNQHLADFLRQTGDTELAEASPYDTFWGIGIRITSSSDILNDKKNWKGKNNLGKLLMEVCDALI